MTKFVGDVMIEVGADIGPLVREMSRAGGSLDKFGGVAKGMGRGLDKLAEKSAWLGNRLSIVSGAIAVAAGAALALTRNAASMGDAIGDGAKAAGMGTTAFQEYRFAIKEAADMTDDEFAASVVKLNKTLGEARGGSASAIAAFEKIGVSQADIARESFNSETALAAFVAKMEATKDPAEAAALATGLFGKSGASLGAALSGVPGQVGALVARARELGVAMGPEAVDAAGKFDAKMKELALQFEAVKMKIAEVLLPILVDTLIPALQTKVIPAILRVIEHISDWITWFGGIDPVIQNVVGWISTAFAVGGPVLLAIAAVSGAISTLVSTAGPIGLLIAAAALITGAWNLWGDDFKKAIGPAVDWVVEKFNGLMAVIDKVVAATRNFFTLSPETQAANAAIADRVSKDTGAGSFNTSNMNTGSSNSRSTGASLADGLIEGLVARTAERLPAVAAAMQTVIDAARAALGVQSPSTVFAEIGRFLSMGMAQGIQESTALVGQAVQGMTATATGAAREGVGSILGALGTLFQGSKKVAAGIALANSWLAFTEVLKDPSFVGRPFARFAAAASALKGGLEAVRNIKSSQPGGTGAGASAGAVAAPSAASYANITLVGDTFSRGSVEQLFTQINEGLRSGRVINLVRQ